MKLMAGRSCGTCDSRIFSSVLAGKGSVSNLTLKNDYGANLRQFIVICKFFAQKSRRSIQFCDGAGMGFDGVVVYKPEEAGD